MFTAQLEHIFTKEHFSEAFGEISKNASGLDGVGYAEFQTDFAKNIAELSHAILSGTYAPEPIKKIEIEKENSDEKRPIGLASIKDKLIQRILYKELNPYFDKEFSDKSYAYRPDKSTLKAINRVTQFLNEKHHHIVKTDIDNFFESIDHDMWTTNVFKKQYQESISSQKTNQALQNSSKSLTPIFLRSRTTTSKS